MLFFEMHNTNFVWFVCVREKGSVGVCIMCVYLFLFVCVCGITVCEYVGMYLLPICVCIVFEGECWCEGSDGVFVSSHSPQH